MARCAGRDPAVLVRIYEMMVLTRAVEDRMVAMYKSGDLLGSLYTGHWHEAISSAQPPRCATAITWRPSIVTSARTCAGGWSRGR